jgi:cytoskeletal protein CcmA (bactofilin family)
MNQVSVIGEGTVVRGSVEGEGSLEILGRVEGDVTMTGDVSVGEAGAVRGNISGVKISVHGAVQGDLRGSEAVLLEAGARVLGDLSAPRLGVAAGALVRGHLRTEGEPPAAQNKRPALAVGLKPAVFAAKPVAKVEPKLVPAPPPPAPPPAPAPALRALDIDDEDEDADEADDDEVIAVAAPRVKDADRRPPPPVLPSLGKGAKAKKKRGRDE